MSQTQLGQAYATACDLMRKGSTERNTRIYYRILLWIFEGGPHLPSDYDGVMQQGVEDAVRAALVTVYGLGYRHNPELRDVLRRLELFSL